MLWNGGPCPCDGQLEKNTNKSNNHHHVEIELPTTPQSMRINQAVKQRGASWSWSWRPRAEQELQCGAGSASWILIKIQHNTIFVGILLCHVMCMCNGIVELCQSHLQFNQSIPLTRNGLEWFVHVSVRLRLRLKLLTATALVAAVMDASWMLHSTCACCMKCFLTASGSSVSISSQQQCIWS